MTNGLDEWRAAVAVATTTRARFDTLILVEAARIREIALKYVAPRRRAQLGAVPTNASDASAAYRSWRETLPLGKVAAFDAELEAQGCGACLAQRFEALYAANKATRVAASQVIGAVVGADARWRRVEKCRPVQWGTVGLGAASYAKGRASMRARELERVGYRVRCAARRPSAEQRERLARDRSPWGSSHLFWPFAAFEVWVWTCAEGAQIAPYQCDGTTEDAIRAAAAEGCNPAAMWQGVVPYSAVERLGADRATLGWERPRPVRFADLEDGAPVGWVSPTERGPRAAAGRAAKRGVRFRNDMSCL